MLKFVIFFLSFFSLSNLFSNEIQSSANIKLINKVSGKNYIYSIKYNESIDHKNLNISIKKCIKNTKNYYEYAAFISIKETKKNRYLFNSWVLSNNISISQFSHPIYSIRLLDCKNI